jgi:hypothetical protein
MPGLQIFDGPRLDQEADVGAGETIPAPAHPCLVFRRCCGFSFSPLAMRSEGVLDIQAPSCRLSEIEFLMRPFKERETFVQELQAAAKDVESHFYQGGRHVLTLDPANQGDATQRMTSFLEQRLE